MIAIGGSQGAIRALQTLLQGLPENFSLPVAVVVHRHRDSLQLLESLQPYCKLPITEIIDKEPIEAGHVYVGPADYHVLVEANRFSLSVDEPVGFSRPSIDLFFASIAQSFGPAGIAVVLTGANSDGAAGAEAIKLQGGLLIVQEPATAQSAAMPSAALRRAAADYVLPIENIAATLLQLSPS